MKVKGIKKAVGEYKDWIKRDMRNYATIMLDAKTGEVWTDCFVSVTNWKEYSSQTVVNLTSLMREYGGLPVSMQNVRAMANKVLSGMLMEV